MLDFSSQYMPVYIAGKSQHTDRPGIRVLKPSMVVRSRQRVALGLASEVLRDRDPSSLQLCDLIMRLGCRV